MKTEKIEVSVRGKLVNLPSVHIEEKVVVIEGKLLKICRLKGEDWMPREHLGDPDELVSKIKQAESKADIFTFAQVIPDIEPKYNYPLEWEDFAVARTGDFAEWWNSLPQASRKNVRRAEKRGVVVRKTVFDDNFVRGIVEIYNETPVRQGRKFWHYGKNFEVVRRENATHFDRSDFLGAYIGEELIGFVKLVYFGKVAGMMQILSMARHSDKRPTNALIAKAVEVCQSNGIVYLRYGRYIYGKNAASPLIEFKRRNGFEKVMVPRYYVPLTLKGEIALRLNLHHGLRALIPARIDGVLRSIRSAWYSIGNQHGDGEKSEMVS
jgi:hypothetical protein